MKARKRKYIPGNIYNKMKEIFIKYWKEKMLFGIYSSGDIPKLTYHEISESNINCQICTIKMWNNMSTKIQLLK